MTSSNRDYSPYFFYLIEHFNCAAINSIVTEQVTHVLPTPNPEIDKVIEVEAEEFRRQLLLKKLVNDTQSDFGYFYQQLLDSPAISPFATLLGHAFAQFCDHFEFDSECLVLANMNRSW